MIRSTPGRVLAFTTVAISLAALPMGCASSAKPSTGIASSSSPKMLINRDKSGLALQGYDPVAYFTLGKPTKGIAAHSSTHAGTTYYFASREHKMMFDAAPDKYQPRFGGYCGYAASINKVSPIDPNYWEILDGELVLQHNEKAWNLWHKDVQGNLKKAHTNWPGLVARKGV